MVSSAPPRRPAPGLGARFVMVLHRDCEACFAALSRGEVALWLSATVRIGVCRLKLLAGHSFGSPQAGAADARLVLVDGAKPLTSASRIRQVTDDHGRTHWTRRRGSCCFFYALPGVEHPCASCPRLSDAERARILATLAV